MVESGNYLVPTFNGKVWFDKPILLYWLMSVPVRLLGPSEIACDYPRCIGTAVTLLLTFFIGKKLFDAKAGLWAEAILATTLLMLFVGSSALVDGIACPLLSGQWQFSSCGRATKSALLTLRHIGSMMGLGMLAKGPLGLLPVFVMIVVLWFGRKISGALSQFSMGFFCGDYRRRGYFYLGDSGQQGSRRGTIPGIFRTAYCWACDFANGRPRGKLSFIPAVLSRRL